MCSLRIRSDIRLRRLLYCLEGWGLGWIVRPLLRRRAPWDVVAQRVKL